VISRLGQPANLLVLPLDVTNEAQPRELPAAQLRVSSVSMFY
jgi:hypothetical protein